MPPKKGGKTTKKGGKTPAPAAAPSKSGEKKNAGKRKRVERWSSYIYKVLKQVHPDKGLSNRSMSIMNSIVNGLLEQLASEAGRDARYVRHSTLSSRDIQTAVRLNFSGELTKHAVSAGTVALTKFTKSHS